MNQIHTDTQREPANTHFSLSLATGIPRCNGIGEAKNCYITANALRNGRYLKPWVGHSSTRCHLNSPFKSSNQVWREKDWRMKIHLTKGRRLIVRGTRMETGMKWERSLWKYGSEASISSTVFNFLQQFEVSIFSQWAQEEVLKDHINAWVNDDLELPQKKKLKGNLQIKLCQMCIS